jgi:hypothetical protein
LGYPVGFAILAVPAFLGLTVLLLIQRIYLNPRDFEAGALEIKGERPGLFWVYLDALGLIGAGYGDLPFIAFNPAQKRIPCHVVLSWRDKNFRLLFNLPDSSVE